MLAISQVDDFSKPLIFAAIGGEENVVFCRLYDAETKTRIRREWNPHEDWAAIIRTCQTQLEQDSKINQSPVYQS